MPLRLPTKNVSADSSSPGAALSTWRSRKRIALLTKGLLLGAELKCLAGSALLQRQPTVVARAQVVVVEDLLDRDRRYPPAFQREHSLESITAVDRMLQGQLLDARHGLGRRGLRMALVDRPQVLEPFESLRLQAQTPLVEARPVESSLQARLGDVAQLPRQFQNAQAMLAKLAPRISLTSLPCGP